MFDRLDLDAVRKVFWLGNPEGQKQLQEQINAAVEGILYSSLANPMVSNLLHIGALKTDEFTVILRRETLHALLRAARQPRAAAMRLAGYEAGVLYGAGVIQWLIAKTKETLGKPALPSNARGVIEACLEIDRKGGMGRRIEITDYVENGPNRGWRAKVVIEGQFLSDDDPGTARDRQWKEGQKQFWQGYLEGAFCSSLGTWYWIQRPSGDSEGVDVPLRAARCTIQSSEGDTDLLFDLEVEQPRYENTFVSLLREILGPHLDQDTVRIVRGARTVVDEFVRELASAQQSAGEKIVPALAWLVRNVPDAAKEAAVRVESARHPLHTDLHVSGDFDERKSRRIVRATAGAILQGCHDIRLEPCQVDDLRRVLLPDHG